MMDNFWIPTNKESVVYDNPEKANSLETYRIVNLSELLEKWENFLGELGDLIKNLYKEGWTKTLVYALNDEKSDDEKSRYTDKELGLIRNFVEVVFRLSDEFFKLNEDIHDNIMALPLALKDVDWLTKAQIKLDNKRKLELNKKYNTDLSLNIKSYNDFLEKRGILEYRKNKMDQYFKGEVKSDEIIPMISLWKGGYLYVSFKDRLCYEILGLIGWVNMRLRKLYRNKLLTLFKREAEK